MTPARALALVGCTSSGKTTVANLIAGRLLLPNETLESPRAVVEFRHARSRGVTVEAPSGPMRCRADSHARAVATAERLALAAGTTDGVVSLAARLDLVAAPFWGGLLSRPGDRLRPGPLVVRDLPGYLSHGDEAINRVVRAGVAGARVLVVLNAAEVDYRKEAAFLSATLASAAEAGLSPADIRFARNRADEFLGPPARVAEGLERATDTRRRVLAAGRGAFGDTFPDPGLWELSALPALAGTLVTRGRSSVGRADWDWAAKTAVSFAGRLAPQVARAAPVGAEAWRPWHWRSYLRVLPEATGWHRLRRELVAWLG